MFHTRHLVLACGIAFAATAPLAAPPQPPTAPVVSYSLVSSTTLTIKGSNLSGGTAIVTLGESGPLPVTSQTATQLVVTAPSNLAPGSYSLSVRIGSMTNSTSSVVTVGNVGAAFNAANANVIPLILGDCCELQSTTLETVSLPPGSYVINAVVLVANGAGTVDTFAQCKLRSPSILRYGHISGVGLAGSQSAGATLPVTASVTLTVPQDISVVCWMGGPGTAQVYSLRAAITAIQVQALFNPSVVVVQ